MIDKLANLMQMFEIGDSMPIVGDLQKIDQVKEPERTTNVQEYKQRPSFSDEEDFDRSYGTSSTINDNPFTKQSNFIAFHTVEKGKNNLFGDDDEPGQKYSISQRKVDDYQFPDDEDDVYKDEEIYDFPSHIKHKNPLEGDNILRPLSSKQSKRYSKCDK